MKRNNREIDKLYLRIDVFIWITCSCLHKKCCEIFCLINWCHLCSCETSSRSNVRVRFWTQIWLTTNKPTLICFHSGQFFWVSINTLVTVLNVKGSGLIVGAAQFCVLPVILTRVGSQHSGEDHLTQYLMEWTQQGESDNPCHRNLGIVRLTALILPIFSECKTDIEASSHTRPAGWETDGRLWLVHSLHTLLWLAGGGDTCQSWAQTWAGSQTSNHIKQSSRALVCWISVFH